MPRPLLVPAPSPSLLQVFCNIRDDEGEHVKTMKACQDTSVMQELEMRKERGRTV